MRDPDAMATEVVLLMKTALAPVLERLAAAEARLSVLGDVRDRLVTVETKAAQPLPPLPVVPDLAPVLERMAVLETKVASSVLMSLPSEAGIDDLRDRLVTLETRSAGPSVTDMGLVDLRMRVATMEARVLDESTTKAIASVSERVAVLETKAPVAGPAGKDGMDGKPGADGVGFEDLDVEFDGDRTLALKFQRGDVVKTFPIALPFLRYKGIYQTGQSYVPGDTVTWANQLWYCHEATITPPSDGSKLWQLCVRKGRDGKDGKDGAQGPPGRDLNKEPPTWRSSP